MTLYLTCICDLGWYQLQLRDFFSLTELQLYVDAMVLVTSLRALQDMHNLFLGRDSSDTYLIMELCTILKGCRHLRAQISMQLLLETLEESAILALPAGASENMFSRSFDRSQLEAESAEGTGQLLGDFMEIHNYYLNVAKTQNRCRSHK